MGFRTQAKDSSCRIHGLGLDLNVRGFLDTGTEGGASGSGFMIARLNLESSPKRLVLIIRVLDL